MSETETSETSLLLRGARIVLPGSSVEAGSLLIRDGRIASVSERDVRTSIAAAQALELHGLTLYPGFIDVHIHGSVGVDTMEADAGDLHRVARFLARRGVTAWLPTLVPAPEDDYRRAARSITELMREQDVNRTPAARAIGVHYEGPFINEQQCGVLRPAYFRTYGKGTELDGLAQVEVEGAAHMMTLAPEIEGGIELVAQLSGRGWIASIGHTRAGVEVLERARRAGARHMTHFLNAMAPLHHRSPGPIGWGLTREDVSVDLIADGVHSDPLMLQLVLRCKTSERVSLISDAVAPAGLGDGEYRIWGETIKVAAGRTSNERGSIAGSVINMCDAVRMMLKLGVAEHEAARMAAFNPARLLGVDGVLGSIEEGKRADLTALDREGRVRLTIVGGRVAHNSLGETTA